MSAPTTTTERSIHTDDDAKLATTILGPTSGAGGSTIVLSHGWAASRKAWTPVVERLLDQGHTIVMYDQRGHGESSLGRTPVTIERLGKDLATILDNVDARDAVLVGHSGGGFAALAYATADPEGASARLRGMALLSTAAHDQETPTSEVKMMRNPVFSWAIRRRWLGRKLLASTMGPKTETTVREVWRELFAATPGQVRSDYFASSRGMDLRASLPAVHIPAIVLTGDADTVVKPETTKVLADSLPKARFEKVHGIGHQLPLESPDRVVRAISELTGR